MLAAGVLVGFDRLGRCANCRHHAVELFLAAAAAMHEPGVIVVRDGRLINLGGLIAKAGLVDLTEGGRAVISDAFFEAATQLRASNAIGKWRCGDRRALARLNAHDHDGVAGDYCAGVFGSTGGLKASPTNPSSDHLTVA